MFALPTDPKQSGACLYPECGKPLGHDSKEEGFLTCHDHRACEICSKSLNPRELELCYDVMVEDETKSITLKHPRCSISNHPTFEQDPTLSIKQSEYDLLNMIRLMVTPNQELNIITNENNARIQSVKFIQDMDWEQRTMHLQMLEACVASVSSAVKSLDRKKLKEVANEREKVKFKKAEQEARTSSRPVGKPATDSNEVGLAQFMERYEIKSRKVGQKMLRDRSKAVISLQAALPNLTSAQVQDMVDKGMDYAKVARESGGGMVD